MARADNGSARLSYREPSRSTFAASVSRRPLALPSLVLSLHTCVLRARLDLRWHTACFQRKPLAASFMAMASRDTQSLASSSRAVDKTTRRRLVRAASQTRDYANS